MIKVIADITMSLDGFVTGGGADPQHGLGDAPELHRWVTEQDDVDTEILVQSTAASGAVVMGGGCSTPSTAPTDGTRTWGYGADQTGTPPFFVVIHSPPAEVRPQRDLGMRVPFVGDLAPATDRARSAATHGDVVIVGGGDVIGQAIEQGVVRRAAPAPRPDGARWWHAVVQIRDAPGVPAARRSCVARRRAPHLRTGLDATRCDSAPLERHRQEALPLRLQPLTSRPPTTRR